ncbi:uncharacterized protein LOC126745307 [Anthonomus grandis grandis]|uniref:uncharacterized protein LOC126745307 n=1 Tax=Anthonomus grandis grandis TaxID=2921223 RepID=UPI00216641DD|nr:uncharacterized protein LOC126745307 [Anthonomus grandis grandis]
MSLEKLKTERKNSKSGLTRAINWLSNNQDTITDISQVQIRQEGLKKHFDRYNVAQDQIEGFPQASSTEEDADKENRLETENKFYDTLAQYENCIKKLSVSTLQNVNLPQDTSHRIAGVKLPDITIAPFNVLDKITHQLPQVSIQVDKLKIPSDIFEKLADPGFFTPSDIDILVGADVYYSLLSSGILELGTNYPTLLNTHLGWIVAGNVPLHCSALHLRSELQLSRCNFSQEINSPSNLDLDNSLCKFWNTEKIFEDIPLAPEDEQAEEIFVLKTQVLKSGSYQVDIPLKSPVEHLKLGDSYTIAEKRFFLLEKRFQKDPSLFSRYKQFIDEYVSLGHAQYIPLTLITPKSENKYFIPHLCVIRESSATTKLRVVFDASSKSSTGYSLNDVTLKGFTVQPELYDILCRFRTFRYVLTTDIEKMYRQVSINPEHRFLQNILWRDNPKNPLSCIELSTVTYGTNFAPFVCTRVLNEIAQINSQKFPLASEAIMTQCFMDDVLAGCDKYCELQTLYDELTEMLKISGFNLHKWCSNSQKFLSQVSEKVTHEYNMNFDDTPNKVLGLKWYPVEDVLCISTPQVPQTDLLTKRMVLSTIAQCFDPLGLVNPVIVQGKILMQILWCKKLHWDTIITDETIISKWNDFIKHISLLQGLKISRNLFLNKTIKNVEYHGFADASLAAYGACIYLRVIYSDNTVTCNLISSKSKVAPIKSISLPKLELCGIVLLAKLTQRIVKSFEKNLKSKITSINLWSDSQIALAWCKSHPSRWTVFVAHRVSLVQDLTSDCVWRYIKSSENPADMLSRGLFSQDILKSGFWFHGPKFLNSMDLNLKAFDTPSKETNLPEERKVNLHVVETFSSRQSEFWHDLFLKFSSFSRLQRVIAYILRFIHNSKNKLSRSDGALTVTELSSVLQLIVQILQKKYFSKEICELKSNKPLSNKNLISLKPFVDTFGILRVGGRLDYAEVSYDQKHPILLPANDYVVSLMLSREHKRLGHAGPQNVLSNFRLRFWPLNGLRQIKRLIRNCTVCFRFNAQTNQQIMASLPKERITISRPFQKVGVDFGGPFFLKSSRLRKANVIKGYIALFVCMSTKAVHLEIVSSLSTEAFLMTFKRFISRRGNPTVVFSDNATNFAGARNQLRELYEFFRIDKQYDALKTFLTQNETEWRFIPPRSPHWGGIWESAIKSTKYHLYRIMKNSQFTFEEFSTILCQIEAILNSRPLCSMSNDPSDFSSLTPGHFLIGTSLTAYPEKDLKKIPENRLSFWQRCSQIQQIFWKRWTVEYLNRLQNRPKWFRSSKNLEVNDLVLLKEDGTPPLKWPLARVTEVMKGADGRVRVVKLKTTDGYYTRPITKVCPLPQENVQVSLTESDK